MDDYKPNSHKYKEEQKQKALEEKKRVEKITTGKVTVKKKGEMSKFAGKIISQEDVGNIRSYLIDDVIIPTIKNTIWDAFTNSLDMVLFGGTGRGKKKSSANKISYRDYYDKRDDRRRYGQSRVNSLYDLDDIVLESRGEAERVLDQMSELIDTYKFVRVSDLYDLIGESCDYTANNYGWSNLRNADVIHTRDGYKLKLPRALPID